MGAESKIVKKFMERLKGRPARGKAKAVPGIPGIVAYKNHGGRFMKAGRPDVEVLFRQRWAEPGEPAITVFIEFKAPGGHPTTLQLIEISRLMEIGALAKVAHSVEEAIEFLYESGANIPAEIVTTYRKGLIEAGGAH